MSVFFFYGDTDLKTISTYRRKLSRAVLDRSIVNQNWRKKKKNLRISLAFVCIFDVSIFNTSFSTDHKIYRIETINRQSPWATRWFFKEESCQVQISRYIYIKSVHGRPIDTCVLQRSLVLACWIVNKGRYNSLTGEGAGSMRRNGEKQWSGRNHGKEAR